MMIVVLFFVYKLFLLFQPIAQVEVMYCHYATQSAYSYLSERCT